jgi:iron-sulfur cluster assembly accessory protein
MITLTDVAADRLQDLLKEQGASDLGLRVFVQGGGCAGLQYGMVYESQDREDDEVLVVKGVRVFVDPFSAPYLKGASIDYQEAITGAGFRVDNPNAVGSCACGSSFRTADSGKAEETYDG